MSDARALDTHELLRLLLEQQACLGQQLATLSQLQQMVIQYLLPGTSPQSVTTIASPAVAQPQIAEPDPAQTTSVLATMTAISDPDVVRQAVDESLAGTALEEVSPTSTDVALLPEPASSEAPEPTPEASTANPPIGEPPVLHAVGVIPPTSSPAPAVVNSRSARYLQPNAPAPPKRVTSQDVNRVARLYEAGEAAHLVLQFGEYRGASLIQVAQVDPDHIRSLALTAQRPQVRAAASAMVLALEASERTATRRRPASSHTSRTGR
jgi:hypothetical protein